MTETTADFAWALPATSPAAVGSGQVHPGGKFKGWRPQLLLGSDVYGKTIGIVGMGRIGQAMARRAGFDMNILYYDEYRPDPAVEKELGATLRALR